MTYPVRRKAWLLALCLAAGASVAQVKPPVAPREWADALMSARDAGDATTLATLLSQGKPVGDRWSSDMARDQLNTTARSAGKVETRRFVEEKKQGSGALFIYETKFSRSGRHEEQVLVQRRDGQTVIDGPISLPCNLVACFTK